MGGGLLTGMLIPVIIYDNQNNLRGEQMFVIALVMGVIGLVCFRFMVTNTKVRVDTTITLKRGCTEVQRHEGVQQLYP